MQMPIESFRLLAQHLAELCFASGFREWAEKNGYALPESNTENGEKIVEKIAERSAKTAELAIETALTLKLLGHSEECVKMLSQDMKDYGAKLAEELATEGYLPKLRSEDKLPSQPTA